MCRWLAYLGEPLWLDSLLVLPEHSLIDQSLHAIDTGSVTNGDGFGVGWFAARPEPGVYHDTRPAWSDANLRNISAHIESGAFLSHVRATSGAGIDRSNCHPFTQDGWIFQHNGQIGGFEKVERDLDLQIAADLYPKKKGQTDSETMFLLCLTFGLAGDAPTAIRRMVDAVEKAKDDRGVAEPFYMTIATTDGTTLYAARHASGDATPPSLFRNTGSIQIRDADGQASTIASDSTVVLSEPVDAAPDDWEEIGANTILTIRDGNVAVERLH